MRLHRLRKVIMLAITSICLYTASNARMTVFIHGTLPPALDKLVHYFDIPWGLTPAHVQGNKYYMGRIPFILSNADPELFPLEKFYLYGWSGNLDFISRKQAAYTLYHSIKQMNKNKSPITLIGHSHGGNVALNLAAVAAEHNDQDFIIDKLILLAVPIQQATAQYSNSPVFKKIYSLYSPTDIIQVLDPQGLYTTQTTDRLFSARTLDQEQAQQAIQASLSINTHDPGHMSFISADFMRLLPLIVHTLDYLANHAQHTGNIPHFALYISTRPDALYKIHYKNILKK
jgi:pimeloyl-ACP methyl ester carboxylesterase